MNSVTKSGMRSVTRSFGEGLSGGATNPGSQMSLGEQVLALYQQSVSWMGSLMAGLAVGGSPPNPAPQAPPGLSGPVTTIIAWGKWGVLVCGVAGLLICAGKMAIGHRNRATFAADGASGVPWVLGGLSLAAVASAIVGVFLR